MDPEGVPLPVNMALPAPVMIEDSILTNWVSIGAGGFGEIYKARHQGWCLDVAIKLLHNDDGTSLSLLREVEMMLQGSSDYVMPVLGIFRGRPQNSGPSAQLGLVMKYMEKGSLESLQKTLDGVPPLPLVFRLAHQVALGINFLHSLLSPILHRDLKPSNVLLDSYLNVKLTDFGLSKPSQTQAQVSKKDLEDGAGTISYMPPEAFDINYKHSRSFDIYSYGILLWSIATGKQPYPHVQPSLVVFLIPKGQRPSLEELSNQVELRGLVELMEKCWETSSTLRPSSLDCTKITEKLYERQKRGINDSVHEVLKKLEQKEQEKMTEKLQSLHVTPASVSPRVEAMKNHEIRDSSIKKRSRLHMKTGPLPPVQEVVPGRISNQRVKEPPASRQASMCDVDMTRSSTDDHKPKASSVRPIGESLAPPSTTRSRQAGAAKNPLRDLKNPPQPFWEPSERKRLPTAPSPVNSPSPHPGSRKNRSLPAPVMMEDYRFSNWVWIGDGGFGEIFQAWHKRWCYNVAIKLLHNYDGTSSSLLRQVEMMRQGSSDYVMPVLGVFNGRTPNSGLSAQLGLVMKYMENGSLESLQKTFDRVQQLPLVFRLAHQVALGINFLHSLLSPILHLDLKPSNVLLDSDLNVKLTDFGLSKPSQTQAQVSKKDLEDGAGTISYMPPEAFDINYKPSRSFDIYSYGILLWSIATGKQPYPYVKPSLVVFLIPKGQRPSLEELSNQVELRGLVELMEKCWETSSTQRPSSLECTNITEKLYERQEPGINDAVYEVLYKLVNIKYLHKRVTLTLHNINMTHQNHLRLILHFLIHLFLFLFSGSRGDETNRRRSFRAFASHLTELH
ncbi:uncharacterized protein LOC128429822 isoform X2 [Pleuronectes platessa]|uniref:uncharacterized protein LOC128429822 isoform X2 n=1 Tax=Pleuronectes platessa TaxID=8262 RepID=UPI00232A3546|nr:uncharacterized protein LOC128429822 isoform X2 [Pleuronectes platessa]